MKVIICGGGLVGVGIAKQLAVEGNDVTIVDPDPHVIKTINDTIEVAAFVGRPAHPPLLEEIGAADAEMIIAVTTSDEVNMVICQVAHSLFNVPVKVARIRHQNYLQPQWKDLYRRDHLPIDYIISPEKEVADAIINRLHVPGAMDCIPFCDKKLQVIELRCGDNCPFLNESIAHVQDSFGELKVVILGIIRSEMLIVPDLNDKLRLGDEVFFVADSQHVNSIMPLFGHHEKEARRVLIVGGGNIGLFIARALEVENIGTSIKLIEFNRDRAFYVADRLSDTVVINGDALDREILFEANIGSTDAVIAVTDDDEVNILASLLSKRFGATMSFSLISKGASYGPLISSLGVDVTINPREMTVSSILQHIRKGKVCSVHSICSGAAEILEMEVIRLSAIADRSIEDINFPKGVKIGAILRSGEVIVPTKSTIIREKDRIVLLAIVSQLSKVDKIFSARMDYF